MAEPRYKRNRAKQTLRFYPTFLGYAYDLDVWGATKEGMNARGVVLVVCEQKASDTNHGFENSFNWDELLEDEDGNLVNEDNDVIVTMPHMVEIYNLWKEHEDA